MTLRDRLAFAAKKGRRADFRVHLLFAATILSASGTLSFAATRFETVALMPEAARNLVLRWWRWRIALPELAAPNRDPSGHFCDAGQIGDTWFLGGALAVGEKSGQTDRTCALPTRKKLFFPLVTAAKFVHGTTDCTQAKTEAAAVINAVDKLYAKIDGNIIIPTSYARFSNETCQVLGPPNTAVGTAPAAVDGYWLSLEALQPGDHLLEYGANYRIDSPDAEQYKRVTYQLHVR